MRFLRYLKLSNYLNLKSVGLDNLKDLNIIIGPSNCGKTSLLRAVNLLSRISFGRFGYGYSCELCDKAFNKSGNVLTTEGAIDKREMYLTKGIVRAVFGYNKDEVEKVVPGFTQRQNNTLEAFKGGALEDHLTKEFEKARLEVKERDGGLRAEHFSPIIWSESKARIFDHMLFCPDERLQTYKGTSIPDHIKKKNLTTSTQKRIIEFLRDVVDPKASDFRHSMDLDREMEGKIFTTSIAEQGSGVKSLICLVTDILSDRQAKILLIDEPELGLNPSSKHAFLKFLIEQSKDKQTFLATHDPTFVNPVLWNRDDVSVYLYSIINEDFVKVNLVESKEDPNTFAGFLPHTTSLKQVHIYVEGTTDVYNFQMFLDKFAKEWFEEDWYRILSKVGIYHLGGDFWSHLLYTIPKSPYRSIVILDGDKRNLLPGVIEKYSAVDRDRFRISNLGYLASEEGRSKRGASCPIYCLQANELEDYLEPRPSRKDKGPAIAHKMDYVPPEIERIFDVVLETPNVTHQERLVTWRKKLQWADKSTARLAEVLMAAIRKGFVNVNEVPHGRHYCFYKGTPTERSIFAALSLTKKDVKVRIRTNSQTFEDPQKWTGNRIFSGWFFKQGEEREFKLTGTGKMDDSEEIGYALTLIDQSYRAAQAG